MGDVSRGMGLIPLVLILGVVLLAGIIVVAYLLLRRRPADPEWDGQDSEATKELPVWPVFVVVVALALALVVYSLLT